MKSLPELVQQLEETGRVVFLPDDPPHVGVRVENNDYFVFTDLGDLAPLPAKTAKEAVEKGSKIATYLPSIRPNTSQ